MNITATSEMEFEEVAEASERIHDEVGDEAEIFWGTSVDETLGEELRVTVIATGIGPEKQLDAQPRSGLRGKVRDITAADLERQDIVDLDEPTFMRHKKAVNEDSGALYRGVGGMAMDEDDLDIPTFLRRKAD
jgi:cell division protein FtsZ